MAKIPFDDFETNANGTLNLLEAVRRYSKKTIFIFLSTNKVYGDNPNKINLNELKMRYEYKNPTFKKGINEKLSIDQNTYIWSVKTISRYFSSGIWQIF